LRGDGERGEDGESGDDSEISEGEESVEARGSRGEMEGNVEESEASSNLSTDRKQHPRSCSCPRGIIAVIPHSRAKLEDEAGLAIVERVWKAGRKALFSTMCQPHLRLLAVGAIGLYNNKTGKKLCNRLGMIYRHRTRLEKLRAKKAKWFHRDRRLANPQDQRGSLRYAAAGVQEEEFKFNKELVFERFTGKGSWQTWKAEGTINVLGVFSYLD
jgi:hypothetical protein